MHYSASITNNYIILKTNIVLLRNIKIKQILGTKNDRHVFIIKYAISIRFFSLEQQPFAKQFTHKSISRFLLNYHEL